MTSKATNVSIHRLDTSYCTCEACELRRDYENAVRDATPMQSDFLGLSDAQWAAASFIAALAMVATIWALS